MERQIAEFKLKKFFQGEAGRSARINLSPSYAEILPLAELLAFEEGSAEQFTQLSLGYTRQEGSLELRTLIASRYQSISPDEVIVTSGSDDALAMLICSMVEGGDSVIVQSPAYQTTTALAEWMGASVSPWESDETRKWEPSAEEFQSLLTPRTRLAVVTIPHNPTGFRFSPRGLQSAIDAADARGVVVVADEVYRDLPLDASGQPACAADLSANAVSVGSLTKAFGMPGVRVGWLATRNGEVLGRVRRLRMHFNGYMPAPSEFLAAIALRHADAILARNVAIARANLEQFQSFLERYATYFSCHLPIAGVVAFPRWLGSGTSSELSQRLLASRQLLLAPSGCFDAGERHVRIGFGTRAFGSALSCLAEFLDEPVSRYTPDQRG